MRTASNQIKRRNYCKKFKKLILLSVLMLIFSCQDSPSPNEINEDGNGNSILTPSSFYVITSDSEKKYYAASDNAIFKSDNGGVSWFKISDFHYVDNGKDGSFFAETFDPKDDYGRYNIMRSSDFGQNWEKYCRIDYLDFWGKFNVNSLGQVFLVMNGDSHSWLDKFDPDTGEWEYQIFEPSGFIDKTFIGPDDAVFCKSGDKTFYSLDNGKTWEIIEFLSDKNYFIYSAFNNIYVSFENHVYESTNKGVTWSQIADHLENVIIKYSFENKLYFTAINNGFYSLYVTESLFSDYYRINLPTAVIKRVFADENKMFLQTNLGLYYSNDGGNTWNNTYLR